jgi:hypothetical protein
MHASVVAHPNIALVKYWGKRDSRLNLPFVAVAPSAHCQGDKPGASPLGRRLSD